MKRRGRNGEAEIFPDFPALRFAFLCEIGYVCTKSTNTRPASSRYAAIPKTNGIIAPDKNDIVRIPKVFAADGM